MNERGFLFLLASFRQRDTLKYWHPGAWLWAASLESITGLLKSQFLRSQAGYWPDVAFLSHDWFCPGGRTITFQLHHGTNCHKAAPLGGTFSWVGLAETFRHSALQTTERLHPCHIWTLWNRKELLYWVSSPPQIFESNEMFSSNFSPLDLVKLTSSVFPEPFIGK